MAIRPQGRKRTLSKKVSSFNMYIDQVYQVRAIMESTAATKDAPVIRVLLDEALGARRRKALGISDSEEPPGQGTAETLHTIQTLLLRLIKRWELVFRRQTVDFKLMREPVIEARAGREVAFEELVAQAFMEKGYTRESINNYFDIKTGTAREYVAKGREACSFFREADCFEPEPPPLARTRPELTFSFLGAVLTVLCSSRSGSWLWRHPHSTPTIFTQ